MAQSTTQIAYHKLTGLDISAAMAASQKSTSASRTVDKNDGTVWAQTVATLMEKHEFDGIQLDTSKEAIDALRVNLCKTMEAEVLASVTIPETGKDRNGQDIKLSKDDGSVKWASWEQTRRIWAYIGDIAKVYMFGQKEKLYPESMKVASRCDILKECKVSKTPVELVKQFIDSAQQQINKIDNTADAHAAFMQVQTVQHKVDAVTEMKHLIDRIDSILGTCEKAEKDAVGQYLLAMATKYYA